MFLRTLAAMAALSLVSCGSVRLPMPNIAPYRIEIQQGNFVSQEMVSQLKPGMSKDQVRFVLGTALIADSFHSDRWDYVFRRQQVNSRELESRGITVFFEEGKLARIAGDVTPAAGADATGVKTPATKTELPEAKAEAPGPGTATVSRPAAQTDSDAPKPAQAMAADKPAAAPVSAGDSQPREKSWWERLKTKVGF